jgi:hypothetical protein
MNQTNCWEYWSKEEIQRIKAITGLNQKAGILKLNNTL